ncbi:MAG: hypothetical protein HYX44_06730, partial [Aquabacterium sp.]|nr:hypothetical protein [Aquabacterium sp.]
TITCEREVTGKKAVRSRSIHSSPLYAPYPFANGQRELLREYDAFTFTPPHAPDMRYRCLAQTTFAPPGDGFAILQVRTTDAGQTPDRTGTWSLDVSFSRASGVHQMPA